MRMPASFGKVKAVRLEKAGLPAGSGAGELLSFGALDMALEGAGGIGTRHRVATFAAQVKLPRNHGVHGVRATARWSQARTAGVRATFTVTVGSATAVVSLPATIRGVEPEEPARGTTELFDIEAWPAATQFAPPEPERALTIPVALSILAQQLMAEGEYRFAIDQLDLQLVTFRDPVAGK